MGDAAKEIRNAIIKNGLYATGPVVYKMSNYDERTNEADFFFYIPVNHPVELKENEQFAFMGLWEFTDTLLVRHADLDEDLDESYNILLECADAYHLTLIDSFYHVYLDVYGDGVIDVFVPVEEGGGE
ncbi:DUF5085 family protein [Evansella sp. AB-rgal1]|uniref:DUF5085 family protein n=1 Tax=Evansella sp. AB-rgal1 TaxID=3242696 RepID=UPI00359DE576